jgi:hypothetical protein
MWATLAPEKEETNTELGLQLLLQKKYQVDNMNIGSNLFQHFYIDPLGRVDKSAYSPLTWRRNRNPGHTLSVRHTTVFQRNQPATFFAPYVQEVFGSYEILDEICIVAWK